ncbi:TIGR02757 family protein [Arcticibacterium luteifluviistationis]|uniref:TIGR02757 family protein n=1 Tax=Arcticibacterium luteifluviistationis TaxID=1784714 RepID=A0A2Z4G843_9BACT|nr:TIGR02757 family protein [Arcticibacterium luteifluviistationis]AWV97327.1 TIGR02757 family protein [Arcticibacterium luteifluviistationis]
MLPFEELRTLLDEKYIYFNRPNFIPNDPVSIPHKFSQKEDIEIAGFLAAILAWGQRKTIINKCNELLELMDYAPHQFITSFESQDLIPFENFKHRTFNGTDCLYFMESLRNIYKKHDGLEGVFSKNIDENDSSIEKGLIHFREVFFELEDSPSRTTKHIASPIKKSACKRINMYLRWMVRKDNKGVDFGIWNKIQPSQLVCPCDVHVERVARKLGLIQLPKPNWNMALELTDNLKRFDPIDPVKYDFSLFGLGVEGFM